MGATLDNCVRCGSLYVKNNKNICPNCYKEIEEEYLRCSEYLREHKQVNMYELSEETDVTVKQITKFIQEGRISIADNPNIGYKCETCDTNIREGRFCKECSERLNRSIKRVLEEEPKKEKEETANIYFQIKDRFK